MCGIRPSWTCKAELGSEIEDGKGREKKTNNWLSYIERVRQIDVSWAAAFQTGGWVGGWLRPYICLLRRVRIESAQVRSGIDEEKSHISVLTFRFFVAMEWAEWKVIHLWIQSLLLSSDLSVLCLVVWFVVVAVVFPSFSGINLSSVCISVHHFRLRKYFIPLFVFMVMILMSVMILTMRW